MEKSIDCHWVISRGMLVRYGLTVAAFCALLGNHSKHIYLILPVVLTILDFCDGFFIKYKNYILKEENCYIEFEYQIVDKAVDSLSYLLFLFLKFDYVTLFFIGYRILGVLLFYATRNGAWLILFFDFIKEYMLYRYLFGMNYAYLLPCMALKIAFEYYFHTFHNKNNYGKNLYSP